MAAIFLVSSHPAAAEEYAEIEITSNGEREVVFSRITGQAVAHGSGGSAAAVSWEDLCVAPCTTRLTPGLHTMMVHGQSTHTATERATLKPGRYNLDVDPGNSILHATGYYLAIVGATTFAVGAYFQFGSSLERGGLPVGLMAGGGAAMAVGIPLWFLNRTRLNLQYVEGEEQGTHVLNVQMEW